MSIPHVTINGTKDFGISSRYRYYIQPGGDEELTVSDVKLTRSGKYFDFMLMETHADFEEIESFPIKSFTNLDGLREFSANDIHNYDLRL